VLGQGDSKWNRTFLGMSLIKEGGTAKGISMYDATEVSLPTKCIVVLKKDL
jgi:hypothetical protein